MTKPTITKQLKGQLKETLRLHIKDELIYTRIIQDMKTCVTIYELVDVLRTYHLSETIILKIISDAITAIDWLMSFSDNDEIGNISGLIKN